MRHGNRARRAAARLLAIFDLFVFEFRFLFRLFRLQIPLALALEIAAAVVVLVVAIAACAGGGPVGGGGALRRERLPPDHGGRLVVLADDDRQAPIVDRRHGRGVVVTGLHEAYQPVGELGLDLAQVFAGLGAHLQLAAGQGQRDPVAGRQRQQGGATGQLDQVRDDGLPGLLDKRVGVDALPRARRRPLGRPGSGRLLGQRGQPVHVLLGNGVAGGELDRALIGLVRLAIVPELEVRFAQPVVGIGVIGIDRQDRFVHIRGLGPAALHGQGDGALRQKTTHACGLFRIRLRHALDLALYRSQLTDHVRSLAGVGSPPARLRRPAAGAPPSRGDAPYNTEQVRYWFRSADRSAQFAAARVIRDRRATRRRAPGGCPGPRWAGGRPAPRSATTGRLP